MKIKKFTLYLLLAFTCTSLWAQKQDKKMSFERLKAMKINFIIEQVDLNAEEEALVWKAFEEYETKVHEKYHKKMRAFRHHKFDKLDKVSESEAVTTLDSIAYFREQKEILDKDFSTRIRSLLTAKQALEIHIAEEKFHRKMVSRSRKRKNTP